MRPIVLANLSIGLGFWRISKVFLKATQLASYSDRNDDLPAIYRQPTSQNTGYHPSHSKPVTAKIDPACSVMFNGLLKPLLPNMDKKQTYDYVMARQDAGESSDENL